MTLDLAALERFPEDLEFLANAANAPDMLTRLGATLGFTGVQSPRLTPSS